MNSETALGSARKASRMVDRLGNLNVDLRHACHRHAARFIDRARNSARVAAFSSRRSGTSSLRFTPKASAEFFGRCSSPRSTDLWPFTCWFTRFGEWLHSRSCLPVSSGRRRDGRSFSYFNIRARFQLWLGLTRWLIITLFLGG